MIKVGDLVKLDFPYHGSYLATVVQIDSSDFPYSCKILKVLEVGRVRPDPIGYVTRPSLWVMTKLVKYKLT